MSWIEFGETGTAKDVMLALRVQFHDLEARMTSKKVDGFDKIIQTLEQIAALSIKGAVFLREIATGVRADIEEIKAKMSVAERWKPES